jgi:hypothetical protein
MIREELMRIIVAAALYFLIVFGVDLLLPFHPKKRVVPAESDPGFDCRNTHALFSFFLCGLKLRYALLQNGNSASFVEAQMAAGRRFICRGCYFVYEEERVLPQQAIPPGTRFATPKGVSGESPS